MMDGLGVPELLIILVIIIILFGPSRLGNAGKALGEAIRGFRRELRDNGSEAPSGEEQRTLKQ